jgi:hypothetical protein
MRIIIKELSETGSITGETILCDGASKGTNLWMGPDGLTLDGQVEAQVQGFLRAAAVKVFNRKNHRIAVSFRCNRDCGTVQAAEAFIIQFYATCKRGTQLVLSSTTSGGTSLISINNAVVQSIKLSHIGVLVRAEFSIVGGSIS